MAQTATRDDTQHATEAAKDTANTATNSAKDTANKVTETARDTAGKAADAGKEATGKTIAMTREAAGKTAEVAKDVGERVTGGMKEAVDRASGTARQMTENSAKAVDKVLGAESNIAKLWIDTTREQIQYNAETMRRLFAVRDWQELSEIQSEYVRESLSRFTHLMQAQFDFGGKFSGEMTSLGREQANRLR